MAIYSNDEDCESFAMKIVACKYDAIRFYREWLGFNPHSGQSKWVNGSSRMENMLVTGNRFRQVLDCCC